MRFSQIPRTEDCCSTIRLTLVCCLGGGGSTSLGPVYIPSNVVVAVKPVEIVSQDIDI